MKSPSLFLKEGKQTKSSKKIREIAKDLKGNKPLETIQNIILWIHRNLERNIVAEKSEELSIKYFRKRTAQEVIEDGFYTGCADFTLVFLVLCRSLEIPARYVEAKKIGEDAGHVWARVYVNGKWMDVDPIGNNLNFDISQFGRSESERGNYVEVEEGLDSWDIGIKCWDDWKKKAKGWEA